MYFRSDSWGMFGGYKNKSIGNMPMNEVCRDCNHYAPMTVKNCRISKNRVSSNQFACKKFSPKTKKGFR